VLTEPVSSESMWWAWLSFRSPESEMFILNLVAKAEARRSAADYDTGSITASEAYALWFLADLHHARVVIEVGTFIGLSTTALAASYAEAVYTCDVSNDCLPSTDKIHTYPKQTSTAMLLDLFSKGVLADFCFFDGVLSQEDADLLRHVTHPETVYAFHDYNYGPKIRKGGKHEIMPRKGIGNVQLLQPRLPKYRLIEPFEGSTLALLVPEAA